MLYEEKTRRRLYTGASVPRATSTRHYERKKWHFAPRSLKVVDNGDIAKLDVGSQDKQFKCREMCGAVEDCMHGLGLT